MRRAKRVSSTLVTVWVLALLAGPAFAAIEVHEVARSSATFTTVSVSSITATTVPATALSGRWALEIQNQDSTSAVYCGFASTEVAATTGRKIVPGASWVVQINSHTTDPGSAAATFTLVCMSDGVSGSEDATIGVVQIR